MRKTAAPTLSLWLSSLLFLGLTACVAAPPPYEDYTLARAAVRAAQDVDSARFSTGLWHKAEESYRNGQKSYKDADFADAKQFFRRAVEYAERAENATRLKKFQSGDSFP